MKQYLIEMQHFFLFGHFSQRGSLGLPNFGQNSHQGPGEENY